MPSYKSPSTVIRDVDIHIKNTVEPFGIPATVIGTARRGPAFVPITFRDFSQFVSVFGNVDAYRFGPLALQQWISSASRTAGTYIRVLGAGDGKRRKLVGENAGSVNNAGFVVGSENVQPNGIQTANSYAEKGGPPGRTYFLGCFMSESLGSTIFSSVGIQGPEKISASPIIRGVIMAPSGVVLSLNTDAAANNLPSVIGSSEFSSTGNGGLSFGDISKNALGVHPQNFTMILNGHKSTSLYPNVITASFDPKAGGTEGDPEDVKYFAKAFNTDPTKIEQAGHFLYTHYDIPVEFAVPTGSGITGHADTIITDEKTTTKLYQTAFLLTSSMGHNSGTLTFRDKLGVPNFENFQNRFSAAFSPYVFSQKIHGKNRNLFRIHSKDDGLSGAHSYKITIANLERPTDVFENSYGKFDLHVRRVTNPDKEFGTINTSDPSLLIVDADDAASTLESWLGLSLDPSDENYICKIIGDQRTYYDFDSRRGSQKLVTEGLYEGFSSLIRVEVTKEVAEGSISNQALPFGFRGIPHLVTSGSTDLGPILTGSAQAKAGSEGILSTAHGITSDIVGRVIQPPSPFRETLAELTFKDDGTVSTSLNGLTWGYQFEEKLSPIETSQTIVFDSGSLSHLTYFSDFQKEYQNIWAYDNEGSSDVQGSILDADKFNYNGFFLENLEILTSSNGLGPDNDQWERARYRRDGTPSGVLSTKEGEQHESRFLRYSDVTDQSAVHLAFTFPLVGGQDGVNIFDKDKNRLIDAAAVKEINDSKQGQRSGPTISSYVKALEILEDKTMNMSVLSIPGIRCEFITDRALETVEERFDCFYIVDVPHVDKFGQVLTGSHDPVGLVGGSFLPIDLDRTRERFQSNPRGTTFGGAYFPDLIYNDPDSGIVNMIIPPSVAVLGSYGNNKDFDKVMGTNRGTVDSMPIIILDPETDEFEKLFQAGINVIQKDDETPGAGPYIRSQISLKGSQVPKNGINIRRLMILVRSKVRDVVLGGESGSPESAILFRNNDATLRKSLASAIQRKLDDLQAQNAFASSFVKIDSVASTKDRKEGLVKGKVIIKPFGISEALIDEIGEDL